MKKARRITRNEEFQEIIQNAPKIADRSFVIYYRPKKADLNRVGISVSKKSGNAVVRNRIKRQVRMMVLETGALADGLDYLIIMRRGYDPDNYAGNKKGLETLLKTVRIRAVSGQKEKKDEKAISE